MSNTGGSGGSSAYSGSGNRVSVETDGLASAAPQTGDKAPVVPTAIAFGLAFIGMITVVIIRRRMDYEWVYMDEDGNIIDNIDDMN